MSLKTKVDPFGIATTGIEITDTSENKTAATVEARGNDGFVVAIETLPAKLAPSVNYAVTQDVTLSGIVLGHKSTVTGATGKVMLSSVTINTAAGTPPTISATGMEVEANGTDNCTVTLDDIAVSALPHAQNFCGDLTITGGELTKGTLTIEGTAATAEVEGVTKASDLVGGKLSFSATIVGVDKAAGTVGAPTVTLASGSDWHITKPLSETNPNGDFPTYAITVECPLAADDEDASS